MSVTHKQLADLLRAFADVVETNGISQAAVAETPKSTVDHLPAGGKQLDADVLKTMLATAGKAKGTPAVRKVIEEAIGGFKTAASMTPDERSEVHAALVKAGMA